MITTALIVYRIHSASQPNIVKYLRTSYRRIIDLLVQSAAAYSVVALIYAISSITPGSATFPSTEHQIPNVYLHAFTYEVFMITAVRSFYFLTRQGLTLTVTFRDWRLQLWLRESLLSLAGR